ncbi:MAG: hypothetical protein A3F16_03330 [Deltaproteobacteria bacterium RIFCSPHIGHO2_12_FULL_43_9]|nr:MAG: hypothetical protein A3F16_03330 [Deltaproteobacteria bacterium RIFCSPHIGHO2_12_FULL_43_9]
MKIKVLGCHGSEGQKYKATSFLINDSIVIDAGTIVSALPIKDLKKIKHIFITHAHLDHIKDLAFLVDNLFGKIKKPIKIYGKKKTINAIQKHLFNDVIWPDFSRLPSRSNPTMRFIPIKKIVKINGISIEPIAVNHTVESVGYIIKDGMATLAITGDTGPTRGFWRRLKREHHLKAIFAEVSFPSRKRLLAQDSLHYTPTTLARDLPTLENNPRICIYHLKPPYVSDIIREIHKISPKWYVLKLGKTIKI